jgi:hypothetical protein
LFGEVALAPIRWGLAGFHLGLAARALWAAVLWWDGREFARHVMTSRFCVPTLRPALSCSCR